MKRVLSLVMTAAIAASLVPATAFAAKYDVSATAKVINAWTRDKEFNGDVMKGEIPELQLRVTNASYQNTSGNAPVAEIKVTLDNAKFSNPVAKIRGDGQRPDGTTVYKYTEVASDKSGYLKVAGDYYFDGKIDKDYVVMQNGELGSTSQAPSAENLKAWLDKYKADGTYNYGPKVIGGSIEDQKETVFNNHKAELGVALTDNWSDFTFIANSPIYGENVYVKVSTGAYFKLAQMEALNGGAFKETTETRAQWEARVGAMVSPATFPPAGWTFAEESKELGFTGSAPQATVSVYSISSDRTEATIRINGWLAKDDVISLDLSSKLDKTSKNATVSVESDDISVSTDSMTYVSVESKTFTASVKKTVKIAENEVTFLHNGGLKLKEKIAGSFKEGDEVSLKLSKGFKFVKTDVLVNDKTANVSFDGSELTFKVTKDMLAATGAKDNSDLVTLTIKSKNDGLKIEADSAKSGAKATIVAKVGTMDKVSVEVAEVVDYKVVMSVDKDKDLPVMYSGVNVNNDGITNSSNHKTAEITLEETFPGAWSMRQGFKITLPKGVYVADVEVKDAENFFQNGKELGSTDAKKAWQEAFEKAYKDGKHENFEFGKRVFDDVNVTLAKNPAKVSFVLVLVADPTFEGEVKVGFEGALVEKQSVSAAKFVVPYKVEAQQNDLKIDSRYTKVPSDILVKETADGLWDKGTKAAKFTFNIEKDLIKFEDNAKFTVDKNSDLEVTDSQKDNKLAFSVKTISDKAATVTISNMELFMDRNIPAGKYALEMTSTMSEGYVAQKLFANEDSSAAKDARDNSASAKLKGNNYIKDVTDYKKTVKDNFINVVTAPRDEDGFTTKISVPVGEKFIMAGEKKIEIDTPAYINGAGYTMLPLRAVAVALGIDNNSVLWDQTSRTATILYGNRVVSMQNGAKVMYINGQAVATKAGVEITNDRVFLSLRDLGTAMNVTDISWDAAAKTAYLNAGAKEA